MSDEQNTQSISGADNAEEYAETICDGINEFLQHSEITLEYAIQPLEDGNTRITLAPKTEVAELGEVHEYTIEDSEEELTFTFDGEELSIVSTAEDWSVFNYELHTGEAISCIIESGQNHRSLEPEDKHE